jgi:hypothetical protein
MLDWRNPDFVVGVFFGFCAGAAMVLILDLVRSR